MRMEAEAAGAPVLGAHKQHVSGKAVAAGQPVRSHIQEEAESCGLHLDECRNVTISDRHVRRSQISKLLRATYLYAAALVSALGPNGLMQHRST